METLKNTPSFSRRGHVRSFPATGSSSVLFCAQELTPSSPASIPHPPLPTPPPPRLPEEPPKPRELPLVKWREGSRGFGPLPSPGARPPSPDGRSNVSVLSHSAPWGQRLTAPPRPPLNGEVESHRRGDPRGAVSRPGDALGSRCLLDEAAASVLEPRRGLRRRHAATTCGRVEAAAPRSGGGSLAPGCWRLSPALGLRCSRDDRDRGPGHKVCPLATCVSQRLGCILLCPIGERSA